MTPQLEPTTILSVRCPRCRHPWPVPYAAIAGHDQRQLCHSCARLVRRLQRQHRKGERMPATIIRECPKPGCRASIELTQEQIRSGRWPPLRCPRCAPAAERKEEEHVDVEHADAAPAR